MVAASRCGGPGWQRLLLAGWTTCCIKSSLSADFRFGQGILLTVRPALAFSPPRAATGRLAMIETVTAFLGVISAGIFLAHAFDGFRSRA
jgi:hypothetical protein